MSRYSAQRIVKVSAKNPKDRKIAAQVQKVLETDPVFIKASELVSHLQTTVSQLEMLTGRRILVRWAKAPSSKKRARKVR